MSSLVAPRYPEPRRAAFLIGVLFIVTLVSQLDRQLPTLLVSPLRREFGISDTAFSVLSSYAFALSFTLMAWPLGRLVDSRSRRNLIAAGLLFWSGATALFALGRSYETLVMARIGLGLGEAVLAPAAFSLISDLVAPARRGRALGVYSVSIAVGSGASLLLGGWLLALIPAHGISVPGLGELSAWRVAFLVAALPGVPLALVLLLSVREPARQRDRAESTAAQVPSVADFIRHLRRQSSALFRLLAYPSVLSFIGYGSLAWAPALFERHHGWAPAHSGVVMGAGVAVAGTVGMLWGGFLSDAWLARGVPASRLRVAWVGVAVAAVPAVSWSLVPAAVPAFGLLFLMVFGISVAQSAVPTSIQAVFPNRLRGQAVGSYLLLSGLLGIGLGPTIVALLTDRLFHNDLGLGGAIALTTGPAALLGLWLLATGLGPYERLHAALHLENPPLPSQNSSRIEAMR